MSYVCRQIEVYEKVGDSWATEATVLTEASYPSVKIGWGKIKDSFTFTLPKGKQYFDASQLEFEALVKIFLWRDSTTYNPQTDLILEGVIKGTPQNIADGGNVITVSGYNFSEVFFDNQIPLNQVNKTWVEILKAILQFLNGNGINSRAIRRIFWYPANPTSKNNGDAFDQKTLVTNYMTASTMVERLTSDEFTGDGQYVWYVQQYKCKLNGGINASATSISLEVFTVDPDGGTVNISSELADVGHMYIGTEKISWRSKSGQTLDCTGGRGADGTTAASHSDGDTVIIASQYHLITAHKSSSAVSTISECGASIYEETSNISINKDRDEVVNFVPYNCGTDLNGVVVEDKVYDASSIGKVAYKTYYATEETQDIFDNIWNKERHRNPSSFNPNTAGQPQDNFPTTYNYTMEDGTIVSSDEEFNEAIRVSALAQGLVVARKIIEQNTNPKYSISYSTRFDNTLLVGQLYDITFPSRALNRKMRLLETQFSAGGTVRVFDEDERTATVES